MNIVDTATHSTGSLLRRKARTTLTAFGVAIGVAALILMISLAIGVKLELLERMKSEAALTTLMVSRPVGDPKDRGGFPSMGRGYTDPLTDEDIEQLRTIDGVDYVYPDFGLVLRIYVLEDNDKKKFPIWIVGIPPREREELESTLMAGRFFTEGAEDEIVLPSNAAERAGIEDPTTLLGKTIRMERTKRGERYAFTVVGVADSKKLGLFRAGQLMMPEARARDLWVKTKGGISSTYDSEETVYPRAILRVSKPGLLNATATRVQNAGFQTLSIDDIIKFLDQAFVVLEAFMAMVGGVGLIVALFGIVNTMTMAVMERTREIGIMKAVGAVNADVLRLFLFEAASIGVLGGAVGVLLGWMGGLLLNVLSRPLLDVAPDTNLFHTTIPLALAAIGFAVIVSTLAGLFPAMRAARMRPVEALRHE